MAHPPPRPLPLVQSMPQVPKEAYAEFAKSAERGAAAHKAWEEVHAAYKAKYPEEYAEVSATHSTACATACTACTPIEIACLPVRSPAGDCSNCST